MPAASKKASLSTPATTKKQQQPPNSSNTAAGEYLLDRLRILLNRLQTTTEILQHWPETQGDSAKVHADTATELIASIRKIVLGLRSVERHVNGTGPNTTRGNDGTKEGAAAAANHGSSATTNNDAVSSISKEALQAFRTSLEDKCPIPLYLLDLLDVGPQQNPFGMNPQCYARGLMKESMRQLAGLERRKRALAMLAQSIEGGMMDGVTARGTKKKEEGEDMSADDPTQQQQQQGVVDGNSNETSNNKRKRDESDEAIRSVKKIQRTD